MHKGLPPLLAFYAFYAFRAPPLFFFNMSTALTISAEKLIWDEPDAHSDLHNDAHSDVHAQSGLPPPSTPLLKCL